MKLEKFTSKYIENFVQILTLNQSQKKKIIEIFKFLKNINSKNTIHVFGNGGSASIASHFSMDLTNNSKIKCVCYNDPSIITCYSNDFGFENWISRAIKKYGTKGDSLILISSSGKSKNMIKGLNEAKKKKFKKIISFTGFDKKNYLNRKSDIGFWINSKEYNLIENSHQFLLLLVVDMIKHYKK